MRKIAVALALLSIVSFPVNAQENASGTIILNNQQENIVRAGTEISFLTRETLTTKKKQVKLGQRVQLETAEAIIVNGVVVIPVGTPAIGEVTEVKNKGMFGKSGYIKVRLVSLKLNGRSFMLSGHFDDKGVAGGIGAVAVSAIVIPVAGFFITGTSAEIPMGTPVKGYLEEDILFQPVVKTPVPIEVPAATTNIEVAQ